jgi:site-specific recombinase XerD
MERTELTFEGTELAKVTLSLQSSKTNQFRGQPDTAHITHKLALKALNDYLFIRPDSDPSSQLFINEDKFPLTRSKLNRVILSWLKAKKLFQPEMHRGWSGRKGGATSLLANGVSLDVILLCGRWKSVKTVLNHYVQLKQTDLEAIVEKATAAQK